MTWTHLRDATPKGAKQYDCALCGCVIPSGVNHVLRIGTRDGHLLRFRMHTECEALTHDWDDDTWETEGQASFRDYKAKTNPKGEHDDD